MFGSDVSVAGQGKSKGKSKGKSAAAKTKGKAENKQTGQFGRNENGLNRNRSGRNAGKVPSDNELKRFRGIARKLDTTPETLRYEYQEALAVNPDLKFGEFVSANVIADNLNAKHPEITAPDILDGLEDGKSLGQTLKELGLSSKEAKRAKNNAKRQIKESKRKNKK